MLLTLLPTKQLKSVAYLSYAHLLLEYAYKAYIEEEEDTATSKVAIKIKNILEQKGWTYENIENNPPLMLVRYYNAINPCVSKHFPAGSQYYPTFLAFIMLHRVRKWKGLEDIPALSDFLQEFVDKLAHNKQERSGYYKTVADIINKLKIKGIV